MDFIKTKAQAFGDAYLETGDAGEAYQKIVPFVDKSSAVVAGTRYLSKPEVKDYILTKLQVSPPTSPDAVVRKWGEMLNASKDMVVDKELVSVPDNPVQLEALKNVTKMYGALDAGDISIDNRSVNINISVEESEKLMAHLVELEVLSNRLMDGSEQTGEVNNENDQSIPTQPTDDMKAN